MMDALFVHPDAQRVLRSVRRLNVKYGVEPSVKLRQGELLRERFLLGLRKQRIAGDCDAALEGICRSLGMPAALLSAYSEQLGASNYVHFGFEHTGKSALVKAYLEFFEHAQVRMQAGQAPPYRMHLGFKWTAGPESEPVVTDYLWHPSLPLAGMLERAQATLGHPAESAGLAFASELLEQATRRVGCDNVFYLEVSEPATPRRSCDINLYRARLPVGAQRHWVERLSAWYGVPAAALLAVLDDAGARVLGHLSLGQDRSGREFLTLYFGVEYVEAPAVLAARPRFF
jgi:hypothetical protein